MWISTSKPIVSQIHNIQQDVRSNMTSACTRPPPLMRLSLARLGGTVKLVWPWLGFYLGLGGSSAGNATGPL